MKHEYTDEAIKHVCYKYLHNRKQYLQYLGQYLPTALLQLVPGRKKWKIK